MYKNSCNYLHLFAISLWLKLFSFYHHIFHFLRNWILHVSSVLINSSFDHIYKGHYNVPGNQDILFITAWDLSDNDCKWTKLHIQTKPLTCINGLNIRLMILEFSIGWRWVISFIPSLPHPIRRNPLYTLDGRLVGPLNHSQYCGEEKLSHATDRN